MTQPVTGRGRIADPFAIARFNKALEARQLSGIARRQLEIQAALAKRTSASPAPPQTRPATSPTKTEHPNIGDWVPEPLATVIAENYDTISNTLSDAKIPQPKINWKKRRWGLARRGVEVGKKGVERAREIRELLRPPQK